MEKYGIARLAYKKRRKIKIILSDFKETLPSSTKADQYSAELDERYLNGLLGGFKAREIKPMPWGKVLLLIGISMVQIVVGAYLLVKTLGVCTFFAKDMIYVIKDGIINCDINWSSCLKQKAIGYITSLICVGISGIKDIIDVYKQVAKISEKAIKGFTSEGLKLSFRSVGLALVKHAIKEVANITALYLAMTSGKTIA